ncbi:MAG: diacylglycerol kinase family protein [Faecalimonas sp.]|nr:diacylglycerol kinase family protein [Faecalimonas sp.]
MKRMLFVYNPNAGRGLIKQKLSDILDIFVRADYELTVYPTQSYRDAYHKVRDLEDAYDLVVCCGGDGTLDEVVTGMMKRKVKTPIGYIPAGTTNDFANSLGLSKDMLSAADTAVNGRPFACDIGTFNKDVFVYVAAFGLFTDVAYQTDQNLKKLLGHAAYILEGIKQLSNVPSYRVKITCDGEIIEDEFMIGMVTNSKSVGGFKGLTGEQIEFDDGEFEVTLVRKPKNILDMNEIATSILMGNFNNRHMTTFKGREIVFESIVEIPWTLDGEFGGEHDYVKIRNEQRALEIMVEAEDETE